MILVKGKIQRGLNKIKYGSKNPINNVGALRVQHQNIEDVMPWSIHLMINSSVTGTDNLFSNTYNDIQTQIRFNFKAEYLKINPK